MTADRSISNAQQSIWVKYLRRRRVLRRLAGVAVVACILFTFVFYVLAVPLAWRAAQAALIGAALLLYFLSNSLCPNCRGLFTVGPNDWMTHASSARCRHCGLHLSDAGTAVIDGAGIY